MLCCVHLAQKVIFVCRLAEYRAQRFAYWLDIVLSYVYIYSMLNNLSSDKFLHCIS